MEVGGNLPRKSNTKGSKPTINKSGITTVQNSTEINNIKPIEPVKERVYQCCSCGKEYKKQDRNFAYSHSPMFKGNNSRLPICYNCLNNLVEQYTEILGDQDEAIKRVCLHWDMYVSESILKSSKKIDANRSRISCYVKNCNLSQDAGKTYDTYLREIQENTIDSFEKLEQIKRESEESSSNCISERTVKCWGLGYSEIEYQMLNDHYKVLKDKIGDDDVKDSLIKDLCEQYILKYRARQDGDYDRYEKMSKLYQQTLATVDLKPKDTSKNTISNNPDECWGVFESIIENYSPAEFIKENSIHIFEDVFSQDEYYKRFVGRSTNNLINGTTIMDKEFEIKDGEDQNDE